MDADEHTALLRDDNPRQMKPKAWRCMPARYVLAWVGFWGFFLLYAVRVNLSVALVAMLNNTAISQHSHVKNTSSDCPSLQPSLNSTYDWQQDGEYTWSTELQGVILGAFFYGYILTQVPGGMLADKYGGKMLVGLSILVSSILTLLSPVVIHVSVYLFIVMRVVEGLVQGVAFPAMASMWGHWCTIKERSLLPMITNIGAVIGTVITFPVAGVLCEYGFAGGWPSLFYLTGSAGCVWFVFWMVLAYDTPDKHPWIWEEEKHYILTGIGDSHLIRHTPWKSILTSSPVWAYTVCAVCAVWGYYTLLTCLPSYLKEILKFDITQNGLISALPSIMIALVSLIVAPLADYMVQRLDITFVRKLMSAIATVVPSVFIIGVTLSGCNRILVIACLCLSIGFAAFVVGSISINQMDLAPNYAGILVGISNTIATIPGIVAPFLVGALTDNHQTRDRWNIVFYITSGIGVFGGVIFVMFGSGKREPWSVEHQPKLLVNVTEDDNGGDQFSS